MSLSLNVSSDALMDAKRFFGERNFTAAGKHLDRGRITISFQKGSLERFLIMSGIVQSGGSFESRITYKKNEEHPEGTLTSSCTCVEWTEEENCSHTAALFLKYHINENMKEEVGHSGKIIPELMSGGGGVHVDHYGRILESPRSLRGSQVNSTFSSLQYILTNRKIVNFPLAVEFKGKLAINLVQANTLDENEPYHLNDDAFMLEFSYFDENGSEQTKISLLEYLYLFNWESGESFHQPDYVQELVKKLRIEERFAPINRLLTILAPLAERKLIDLSIKGTKYDDLPHEMVNYRFQIKQGKRKSYLDFYLEIFDDSEHLILPPEIFGLYAFDQGLLSSFRTKNDAQAFIKDLRTSIEFGSNDYKKHLFGAGKKALSQWMTPLFEEEHIIFSDPHLDKIFFIPSDKLRVVLKTLIDCFNETLVRFSFIDKENKRLLFQVPKNQLFESIADFYKKISVLNIPIFYNETEVKTWTSNIKFERKQTGLDWFELDLVIDDEDLNVIKKATLSDNFLLSHQGLVILEKEERDLLRFMKKYTNFESKKGVMTEGTANRFSLNIKRSRIFELFELKKHGIEGALTKEEEELCENLLNLDKMPEYPLPDRYKELARHYQETGYQWLRFLHENRFGACLADDMGLGKTLQTIMFLQSVIKDVNKVLIVCPVSILMNWQNEIKKFADFDIAVYYGGERDYDPNAKVILTSYGVMKKESYSTFQDEIFDILIMDEVQHLKNIRSIGANAARNLKANFRICLTGTPVENDLSEFYNIMDLSIPGIWGETNFIKTTSTKKSRLLARQTVRPFILRRTKDQVLTELPEKIENHVFLSFSDGEKDHYTSTLSQIKSNMDSVQTGRKYGEILKSLLKLRQLCLWQQQHMTQSTKIEFLIENLEQILGEGHKVLVFSQFTTYLDIIQNKIREHGWKHARIDGSQSFKKRADEVERFQEGDAQVFLISLKAGGVGLNLTAASYIFLMDPWWNPAVESQAIDRAHRIGQENKLTVYRPIIKDTVEEKVLILQNNKKELFKDLMAADDDNFFSGKLSMEDFQALLN